MLIKLKYIALHPDNPRRDAEAVDSLAASIKAQGLLQAITVAEHPDRDPDDWSSVKPRYVIIDGHRRYTAAKLLGREELECTIRPDLTDRADQIAAMLSTAREREGLTAAEEATGIQAMLDLGENVGTIADRTGLTKTKIRTRVKVASLPESILEKVHTHAVTLADAAFIADHKDYRDELEKHLGTRNWAATRERIARQAERDTRVTKQLAEAKKLDVPIISGHFPYPEIEELTGLTSRQVQHVVTHTWSIKAYEALTDEQRELAFVRALDYDNVASLLVYKRIDAAPSSPSPTVDREAADAARDEDAAAKARAAAAEEASRQRMEQQQLISAAAEVRKRFLETLPVDARAKWFGHLLAVDDVEEAWWIDYETVGAIGDTEDPDTAIDNIKTWMRALSPADFAWHCALRHTLSNTDSYLCRAPGGGSAAYNQAVVAYADLLGDMGHVLSDIEVEIRDAAQAVLDAEAGQ